MQVSCERDAAHRTTCSQARLVSGQAPTAMFVLEQREMRIQFTCELPLGGLASKDVENPEKETLPVHDRKVSTGSSVVARRIGRRHATIATVTMDRTISISALGSIIETARAPCTTD